MHSLTNSLEDIYASLIKKVYLSQIVFLININKITDLMLFSKKAEQLNTI